MAESQEIGKKLGGVHSGVTRDKAAENIQDLDQFESELFLNDQLLLGLMNLACVQ